jgi:hypothetical protein
MFVSLRIKREKILAVDAVTSEPVSAPNSVNREIYREFWPLSGPGRVYCRVNTEVSDFWPAIVTGNEQGNNRRDNRENMP